MAIYSDSGFITARDTPLIRPTLDLNFAREKRLDSRVLFTRDSSATYTDENGIIRTAANNVPRFDHDPATGESLGLLIEESRTNKVSNSITMTATSTGSVTPNTTETIAPDGTNTAVKVTKSAVWNSYSEGTSTTGTISWFAKKADNRYVQFQTSGTGINNSNMGGVTKNSVFDFDTETFTTNEHGISYIKYLNGWYRFYRTYTTNSQYSGSSILLYAQTDASNGVGDTIDETGTVYGWGIQYEVGSFLTSYIPTSGSTVTRGADVASISGTNFAEWYNPTESSIICSYSHIMSTYPIASGNERLYRFRAVGGNDTRIDFVTYNDFHPYIAADGSAVASLAGFTSLYNNQENKTAVGIQQNNFVNSFNGQIKVTDSSGAWPPNNSITEVFLGSQGSSNFLNGHINKFLYYPKRLPNAQLQALTS